MPSPVHFSRRCHFVPQHRARNGRTRLSLRGKAARGTEHGVDAGRNRAEIPGRIALPKGVNEGKMVVAEFLGTVDRGGVVGKFEGDHRGLRAIGILQAIAAPLAEGAGAGGVDPRPQVLRVRHWLAIPTPITMVTLVVPLATTDS